MRVAPFVVATLLLGGAPLRAQTLPSSSSTTSPAPPRAAAPTRIDPALRALFGFHARFRRTPAWYRPSERFDHEGVSPVVIRFAAPLDAARVTALAALGVEWERGGAPLASGAYAAKIDAATLARLALDPTVTRVTGDLPRRAHRPLVESARETGLAGARRAHRAKDGAVLDGTGVKIADIDSGVFPFHPSLFRADGGVHAWVDVDGDGRLRPGVDGVDLDGSGTIEPTEILRELRADLDDRINGFDPALDWLYVDVNRNGQRDFGREFGESAPGYGESIFLVDDVDGDGKTAPSEKLLRLGTSKISAVRAARTYTRGSTTSGISVYGASLLRSDEQLEYASHGTAVTGILVSGTLDRSRMLGLAPGADVIAVGYGSRDPSGTVASVQWAIDQQSDIILTEYAQYVGYPLDGSTEEETLLDAAVDQGIAVVNPAGNLAIGYKHRTVTLVAGNNEIPMKTDSSFGDSPYVGISLVYRGDPRTLALKLALPDGTTIDLPASAEESQLVDVGAGRTVEVQRRTTSRGTHELHLQLYDYDGNAYGKLPGGKWRLTLTSDAPAEVELFCGDAYTSWAYGFQFEENTPARTLCHPATNDKGITVAAYALHRDDGWGTEAGALASYSSLGPRIDGVAGIDLGAPDNPFAPTVPSSVDDRMAVPYAQFGGTSGAGPHVAAALAILQQHDPTLRGAALQAKLLDHARRDGDVGDEEHWGRGKLDLAAALGLPRKEGAPPKVTLVVPATTPPGKPIELRVTAVDDGAALRARWDLEYDGKFDTEWEPLGQSGLAKTITVAEPSIRFVRVDVLDADGHVRGATARLVIEVPKPVEAFVPASATAEDGGCGCGIVSGSTPLAWMSITVMAMILRRRNRARTTGRGASALNPD